MDKKLCHCGKPLHYGSSFAEAYTNAMIKAHGEYENVYSLASNKTFKVPRHYMALHPIDYDKLHTQKFEEVK